MDKSFTVIFSRCLQANQPVLAAASFLGAFKHTKKAGLHQTFITVLDRSERVYSEPTAIYLPKGEYLVKAGLNIMASNQESARSQAIACLKGNKMVFTVEVKNITSKETAIFASDQIPNEPGKATIGLIDNAFDWIVLDERLGVFKSWINQELDGKQREEFADMMNAFVEQDICHLDSYGEIDLTLLSEALGLNIDYDGDALDLEGKLKFVTANLAEKHGLADKLVQYITEYAHDLHLINEPTL